MVDAYTTRGGIIKPESGQSLNTWGTKLNNNAFDIIDKGLFGFEPITVTTDFSLTRTNGDATSTQLNKGILLGGTPTADFTVTVLSYEHIILWRNNTGRNATIKVSAGTGVTLADGQTAFLGYNAALGDIVNVTSNVIAGALTVAGKISGVVAGTLATDAVNKTQMEAAIAVLAGVTIGGLVLTSSTDLAAKYLSLALQATATSGVSLTPTLVGTVNEFLAATLNVAGLTALGASPDDADLIPIYDASATANRSITILNFMARPEILALTGAITATVTSGTTLMTDRRRYKITGGTVTLPTMVAGSFVIVEMAPALGTTITVGRNSQTIDGASADDTFVGNGGAGPVLRYEFVSTGVVTSRLIGGSPF